MAHVLLSDVQAWLEGTKANLTQLDASLEQQISAQVLAEVSDTYSDPGFGVPTWTDSTNTPELVKQVIAMLYAGWYYDRQFAEMIVAEGTSYGEVLRAQAEVLEAGIINGSVVLIELVSFALDVAPVFYPTDVSSTFDAERTNTIPEDMSLGPAKFGMGKKF
jgi:hypothetical protein